MQSVKGYFGGVMDRMLNVVGAVTGYHIPDVFEHLLSMRDEEGIQLWKDILKELKEGNQDKAITELNQIMGSIGVQLTGGAWNPWHVPPTPPSDPNQSQYDRENRIHP